MIEKIRTWVLVVVLAAIPVFFLPFTQDFYEFNKLVLLVVATSILLLLWGVGTVLTKKITITRVPILDGFVLLFFGSLVTLLFVSTNKMEAAVSPLGIATFLSLAIMILTSADLFTTRAKTLARWALFISTSGVGLVSIYQYAGLGKLIAPGSFFANPNWTPTGTSFGAIVLLILVLPLVIAEALDCFNNKKETHAIILSVITLLVASSLVLSIYQILPVIPFNYLPITHGWTIAFEVMREVKQAFLGVGPENFLSAFTRSRPAILNMTPIANIRFTVSSTFFTHIVTTFGIIGVLGLLLVLRSFLLAWIWELKNSGGNHILPTLTHYAKAMALFLSAIAVILAPPSITLLCILLTIYSTGENQKAHTFTWHPKADFSFIPTIILILVVAIFGVLMYGTVRIYASEFVFFRSLQAYQKREGTPAYNLQMQALNLSPWSSRMHIAFSQTNIGLAAGLIRQSTQISEPETTGALREEDRQMISTLVQQAIREAKIAISLDPDNILAWENIASLYENLSGIAAGTEPFAMASVQKAVSLDPTNPQLRLRLGGLYLQANDPTKALEQFMTSAKLKPDFANAYYNIANIYKLAHDPFNAQVALEQTRNLVPDGSDDARKVDEEIQALTKRAISPSPIPEKESSPSSLTKPNEPRLLISPKIPLPNEPK